MSIYLPLLPEFLLFFFLDSFFFLLVRLIALSIQVERCDIYTQAGRDKYHRLSIIGHIYGPMLVWCMILTGVFGVLAAIFP